jgi:hypothetical protein
MEIKVRAMLDHVHTKPLSSFDITPKNTIWLGPFCSNCTCTLEYSLVMRSLYEAKELSTYQPSGAAWGLRLCAQTWHVHPADDCVYCGYPCESMCVMCMCVMRMCTCAYVHVYL